MNNIELGVELMGYGLLGVFVVLILFYFLINLLVKLLPYKKEE